MRRLNRWQRVLLPAVGGLAVALLAVSWLRPQEVTRGQILLGTYVEITAFGGDAGALERAVSAAFEEVRRVHEALSRSGDGALGRLNRAARGVEVAVDGELFGLLKLGQEIQTHSDGAFDLTLARLVDLWGFHEDWDGTGRVPGEDELRAYLDSPRDLELRDAPPRARLLGPTTELDLGGIAKGYAVDRALAVLRERPVQAALVNAGGNVRAFGVVPEPVLLWVRDRPFQVAVQHPRDPAGLLGVLTLTDRAVATSGDYQRFFFEDGVRHHHVLDPQTGRPANRLISATVIAPTAVEADALSTAVFVLGPDLGLRLVERLDGVEAVLVTPAGEVLTSSGLDADGFAF